ncbi:hypothetical protein LOK49_LG07G02758 [Camellia lanceoleosa]|uniref:Uncharacterized protein n=1 Tax=Camellia lanceoleosa TaxID=1840588 RepID=A0ACC0H264_9ERIC|nr:hypothetical protein LOK49_LG07G02758 [Camellia lanceoleosa]
MPNSKIKFSSLSISLPNTLSPFGFPLSRAFPLSFHMEYMNQIKQHNIQTLDQLTQFHFSKKLIQILLSISAFSFLFSCSPLFPLFTNHITSFSMQILSYTTQKNFIFLFCNGILVFLIRNSGLPHTSQTNHNVPELGEKIALAREEVVEIKEEKIENSVTEGGGNENEVLNDEDDKFVVVEEEEGEGVDESEDDDEFVVIGEEEGGEGMGLLSAEELNKKCDEFIRKMREEIKIEAQRLIMV